MPPGSRNNRAPNSFRELVEHTFHCTARLENDDRIEENCNAGVSRCKLNHTRNGCALKQLKYLEHFVECFFGRVLKLRAHAHDQCRISKGNNFHNPVIPSEVEESRGSANRFATGSFDSAALRSG